MKNVIPILAIVAAMLSGCVQQQVVGGDRDQHGCIGSAGYKWCPSEQRCMRMWEEFCPEYPEQFRVTDFKSCVAAGNPVMESHPRQCIHDGTTYHEVINDQETQLATIAQEYCGQDEVDSVYICGSYVQVVSSLLGGGSTFIDIDKHMIRCPVVGPDSMSPECKALMLERTCDEQRVC
jgi:hypothetical protein